MTASLASIGDNPANVGRLLKQLKTRVGITPFIGAGMSVPFGFLAWRPFLESLAPDGVVKQQLAELLARGEFEAGAELVENSRGKVAFQAALEDAFGLHRLPKALPPSAVLQLPRLCSGPVLTTNFDPVLEKVFENARRPLGKPILGMDVTAIRSAFAESRRVLVKLHGNVGSRVLTWSDYEKAYHDREPLKAILRFVMTVRPLLFLGSSLENDRTVRVLEVLAEDLRRQKAEGLLEHFAILARPRDEAEFIARCKKLNRLGILPIWYPSGKHEMVADILAILATTAGHELVNGDAPREPLHYLMRDALGQLRDMLLASDAGSVGITGHSVAAGIQGMGGVGKTVLAAALTRDPDVQRTFPDGIFWLTLGQHPNLLDLMNRLAGWLGDCGGPFTSWLDAQPAIRQSLTGRRALLMLDDVWLLDHAIAFNLLSPPGRLLITTRLREAVVGMGAAEFCVDVLSLLDAKRMLANWAGVKDENLLPPLATEVAQECGCLPLALAMVGAMVQLRPAAWSDALELLRGHDLHEFRRLFPNYPYPNLFRAIAVGVNGLPHDDRDRYLDLAVFPEDLPIPEGPLQVLWGLPPPKTRVCMDRLAARSLATIQKTEGRDTLVLHRLQGDYVRQQRENQLPALHNRLVDAYRKTCPDGWSSGSNDGYLYDHICNHLREAGFEEELKRLLITFPWLAARLESSGIAALIGDYEHVHLSLEPDLVLLLSALRMAASLKRYALGVSNKRT
jgi:hypothetical protein